MTIVSFIILSLAIWRVSNMLADTDQSGPFDLLDWIRAQAGVKYASDNVPYWDHNSFAAWIMCVRCSSVWLGLLAALCYFINTHLAIIVALPFALSAVAFVVQEHVKE